MATPQRLPIVNSDDGTWGDIIRQYIKKEHYDDGTDNAINGGHQNITIRPGTTTAAPLTFNATSAALLTTPADGAVEYVSSTFYITTGSTRKKIAIYDDSSGATGDLYYRDSSGNFVRLGVGSTGQALKVSGGLPAWGNAMNFGTVSKNTSYTITTSDTVVFADASSTSITVTLPAASGMAGYRFYVKRIDSPAGGRTVTISPTGTDNIDGANASFTIDQQYTAVGLVSNGSAWYIL